MNKKKIVLGALTGLATIATPIAAVVSCGAEEKYNDIEIKLDSYKNSGMKMNFKLLSARPNNLHENQLMEQVDGKWVFKKADTISFKNLEAIGRETLNITLSDTIKAKIKGEYNLADKKYKNNHIELELDSFNGDLDKEFFRDLTTSDDEAAKIAKKLEDLEKNSKFRLAFNLVLPKWMETEFGNTTWDIKLNSFQNKKDERGYVVEQIQQVSVENNANIKIKSLYIDLDLKSFDLTKLPKGLKELILWGNNLTSFDPTNLPKGIQSLNLQQNNLTSFDLTKLPKGLINLNLGENNLTSFDPTKLPKGLKELYLSDNKLTKENDEKIKKWWKDNGKIESDLYL
ncbi:MAG: hypothetical protein GY679_01125 [Mycoplasma sp.]|nr:hypothetical protein [Mycoplasma sp.]